MSSRSRLTVFVLPAVLILSLLQGACSREAPEAASTLTHAPAPPSPAAAGPVQSEETAGGAAADTGSQPEVIVLHGVEVIQWLESENWWGEAAHAEQLQAPHVLLTGINPEWQVNAQKLPVEQKKEIFYRLMLPLVLHANEMVMSRRASLETARQEYADGGAVSPASLEVLQRMVRLLPGIGSEHAEALAADDPGLPKMIEDLLYRVDVVPPGLALGQAAYESGYGTSRFAVEGNALFGQWTYGGGGMKPEHQRTSSKGDHRIASVDWPFDSVRGYFINLMSHSAYEEFRRLRAELRAAGQPLDSLALAEGLLSYSERGREYVDSLKGMIRHNHLDVADDAAFRDEPMRFLVTEPTAEGAEQMKAEVARLRETGELADIIARMRLD